LEIGEIYLAPRSNKARWMFTALPAPSVPGLHRFVEDRTQEQQAAALRPIVMSVIAAVLGEPRAHPDVEDCTHETMRRAIEGRARLREGEPLAPWLVGIARHVALDMRRTRQRVRARTAPSQPGDSSPAIDRAVDPEPGPFERLADAEERSKLLAVVEQLPDGPRKALTLFHVEGLAYDEIARKMGVPLGTVATWVTRGRKAVVLALDRTSAPARRGPHAKEEP
jgi:RNA polymerase sigma factor (sigma-70 family)